MTVSWLVQGHQLGYVFSKHQDFLSQPLEDTGFGGVDGVYGHAERGGRFQRGLILEPDSLEYLPSGHCNLRLNPLQRQPQHMCIELHSPGGIGVVGRDVVQIGLAACEATLALSEQEARQVPRRVSARQIAPCMTRVSPCL